MRSKKIVVFLFILVLSMTTLLMGCNKLEKKEDNKVIKYDKEQYLNLVLSNEPSSLDISRSTDVYSSIILKAVEESLTRVEQDKDGKDIIKPAAAESWKISEDGLTWIFKLRDNKWSDGEIVKASHYEYSIKRTLDPKVASEYAVLLEPIKGVKAYTDGKGQIEDVGIKAIDEKTLEIKLERPTVYFLNLTYLKLFAPQRKDIVEKYGNKTGVEVESIPCCGPFVLKTWVHNSKIELEKNKDYWDVNSIKLNKVTFNIIQDETVRMNELLKGSIDLDSVEKKEWKYKAQETKNFDIITVYQPTTDYMFFNVKDKLFSNAKIRKAFSIALDREEMCKVLYEDSRIPAYAWCPPTLQIGTEDFRKKVEGEPIKKLKDENKDPKALFVEGLKEVGEDGDPSKIIVTLTSGSKSAKAKQVMEYQQALLQKVLGCGINIDYYDWGGFLTKIRRGNFQVSTMAWTADYNDPMTEFDMWTSNSGMNRTGWKSPIYDDLIIKAANTIESKVRFDAFKEAEKILVYKDVPIAPIDYRINSIYKRKYVRGFMMPLFGSGMEFKYAYTEGRE